MNMWAQLMLDREPEEEVKEVRATIPRGHLEAKGATAQLLRILASNPSRYWARQEIYKRMEIPKALNWSLNYSHRMGWIKTAQDDRSVRYQRYAITKLGLEAFR